MFSDLGAVAFDHAVARDREQVGGESGPRPVASACRDELEFKGDVRIAALPTDEAV
jgi:hypothetical protein